MPLLTDVDEAEVPADVERRPEVRSFGFEIETRSDDSDGLTLEGYAAVFGQPAEIRDWRGQYLEQVQRGTFKKSLSEQRPFVFFEHGRHPIVGRMPIAQLQRASEDSQGVHIRARVFDNWLTEPVRDAIRAGEVPGMSVEMIVLRDAWSQDRSSRTVQEAKLIEVSPVLAPAYTGTSVALRAVRSLDALVDADPELRAAWDAAREGTSRPHPEPLPPEHSVPETTLALYARVLSRRRVAA